MFKRRKKLSFLRKLKKNFSSRKKIKRSFKYLLWRLKRLPGTPEYIATGFAIGMAVNFWPVLFTHLILGYLLARLLKGDLIAMLIGTLFGNPWTFAVVYPLMYKLGKVALGVKNRHRAEAFTSIDAVWHEIWPVKSWHSLNVAFHEVLLPMGIGGFLLGLPCVLASYYIVRNLVSVYRAQRRKALIADFHKTEHEIEDHL